MSVAEIIMIGWKSGVTRKNETRNEYWIYVKESIGVDKMREIKLKWFGHTLSWEKSEALKIVMENNVGGERGR